MPPATGTREPSPPRGNGRSIDDQKTPGSAALGAPLVTGTRFTNSEIEEMYRAHRDRVIRFVRGIGGGRETNNLAGDAWVRFIRLNSAGRLPDNADVSFVCHLARGLLIDRLRQIGRRQEAYLAAEERAVDECLLANAASLQPLLDQGWWRDPYTATDRSLDLAAALRDLPPRQKTAVFLRHAIGLSTEHVASYLGISPHTVKDHVRAALDSLKNHPRLTDYQSHRPGASRGGTP